MTDTPLTIRPACKSDWETMIAIANRAFLPIRKMTRAALGDAISDVLYPTGDERSKGLEVQKHLDLHPDWAIVCESEGKIVGFATYRIDGKIGTISNNGADPLHHVPGTGTAMYRKLMEIFRAEGCSAAKVMTGLDDVFAPARRAYEKAGFQQHVEHITYYCDLTE